MASFNSWNGDKIHGNRELLTDVLRGELGFDGFVVSDWNGIGQVSGCTPDNCAQAINAGIDMVMVPEDWRTLYDNMLAQVRSGEITEARVDEAVTRILKVKFEFGADGAELALRARGGLCRFDWIRGASGACPRRGAAISRDAQE